MASSPPPTEVITTLINRWVFTMLGSQSFATSTNTLPLQAAPQALRLRPQEGIPERTGIQFTIKPEDYLKTMQVFNDLAWEKGVNSKVESDVYDFADFGGGQGLYNTLTMRFRPDREDGSYSPEQQTKLRAFDQAFQTRLSEAGIRNYAPEA